MNTAPSARNILNTMESLGHLVFNHCDYDLNLIGIRTLGTAGDRFDDFFCAITWVDGQMIFLTTPSTTDPGVYCRNHPTDLNPKGAGILMAGQHRRLWDLGKHKGSYMALKQNSACYCWRVKDLSFWEDLKQWPQSPDEWGERGAVSDYGIFGCNGHASSATTRSTYIGRWSYMCQVMPDWAMFKAVRGLVQAQKEKRSSSVVSYTLLEEHQMTGWD